MAAPPRYVVQRVEEAGARRQRISKACDQCNAARAKCDGSQPCSRCIETASGETCSYTRPSRRHGRGSKVHTRPLQPSTRPNGDEQLQGPSQPRPPDVAPTGPPIPSPREKNAQLVQSTAFNEGSNLILNHTATPVAWLAEGMPYGGVYDETNWLNDFWAQQTPSLNIGSVLAMQADPGPTPHTAARAAGFGETPRSSMSQSESVRYPVLAPLMPYLSRILSPALASDLLESYIGYTANDDFSPTSPLLIAHIFRAESILSVSKPRKCSLALLSSMLLVSANTTEFPFFGASPTARARLHQQLLQLTVALMDKASADHRKQGHSLSLQKHIPTIPATKMHSDSGIDSSAGIQPSRATPIDTVVTLLHIALVTTTTEAKPPGSHWFRIAIQLAKDYKLNQDINVPARLVDITSRDGISHIINGNVDPDTTVDQSDGGETSNVVSPMSVNDNAIVEHSDAKLMSAESEEREERRRVWWTLYIWDRHLALRYNSPLSIKDAESQDTRLPMDETVWQTSNDYVTSPETSGSHRPRGPPPTIQGTDTFSILIPIMCILGQIIDMHHVAYHPRVERGPANPVAAAYTQTIMQQLSELEPSIAVLEREDTGSHYPGNARYHRLLGKYALYLFHLLHLLLLYPWDKLLVLDQASTLFRQHNLQDVFHRCISASAALENIVSAGPDMGSRAMFFGIFLYHGSTIPWAIAASFKSETDPAIIQACEIYVRAFEASNCTYQAEFIRKMRRLLLLTMNEIRGIPPPKTDQNLQNHILRLYRWTGDGTGLAL